MAYLIMREYSKSCLIGNWVSFVHFDISRLNAITNTIDTVVAKDGRKYLDYSGSMTHHPSHAVL